MIVDTHVHYIEPPTAERPYAAPAALRPITAEAVVAAAGAAGVDRVVQVTASTMGDDNRFSFEGARRHPDRVIGVIGRFDPLADDLGGRLRRYWLQPEAVGIRLTLFHAWSRGWLADRALDPLMGEAAALRLPVFIHAPGQTRALNDLAVRHPDTRIVVDHMNIRHEPGMRTADCFAHWPDLCALATLPNVWIKVSYFPEASFTDERWPFPTATERLRRLYGEAGAGRLIWGSNFPPVERACSYRQALAWLRDHCATFIPPADRAAILGRNFLDRFMRNNDGDSR